MNEAKNKAIKEKGMETRLRHSLMDCKTYEMKIDESHLSKKASEFLKMLFLEAKWFTNDVIASEDIFHYDYKNKVVTVLKDGVIPEERQIQFLPAQVRQSLVVGKKQDIINLHKAKEKGHAVGALNYRKRITTIPLNQFGVTFDIVGKH